LVLALPSAVASQRREGLNLDKIPTKILEGLKAKFPDAEIYKWTKEQEGDIVVYDFEFKHQGQKFEADIKEDGTFHNWEKAVTYESLPDAVKKTVEQKYPNATIKEVMEITAVKNGKDELEGYEVVLEIGDRKGIEITLAPDGKILEEDSEAEPMKKMSIKP
jgi:hypothetical protein